MGAELIMGPNFLLLARKAIVEALELTSGKKQHLLKLNKLQCKYVAHKLSETGDVLQFVESAADFADAFERCEVALKKEVYRVVTVALSLIKECCGKQWLRAAIRQRSDKNCEDFADICYEVQWCTSILCISLQIATSKQDPILAPEGCDGRLGAFDLFKLMTAAKQDREDLRSNLERLRQDHVCDASCVKSRAEICYAAQFLIRLDHRPTALEVDSVPKNLPSLLWKVHPRDLPEVRYLARGGFGEVSEIKWLEERYAKKVFREASWESFKTESAILAGLCHPHVVRIVCWSKEERRDYSLVMHLMQEDLFKFLHPLPDDTRSSESDDDDYSNDDVSSSIPAAPAVPLSMPVAVDLMLQVARGLKYLHSKSIVHRDVKSLNVLVKPLTGAPELEYKEGYLTAQLADFGTSKTKNSNTRYSQQTAKVGTTSWMAPEVFGIDSGAAEPRPAYPFKADVYSFALVCYEILTRKEPFEGELKVDLPKRIALDRLRPKLPDRCPRRLASLIKRCWEHEPIKRPNFPEICTELRYIKGLLLIGLSAKPLLAHLRVATDISLILDDRKSAEFSYEELTAATDDFSTVHQIGQDGSVFLGEIHKQKLVIKKMTVQVTKACSAELRVLTHVHHTNLVQLIGYCTEQHLCLVYEYFENRTLDHHLHGKVMAALTWSQRVQIALDAAQGLVFIHEHKPSYIHCNIKSANILIDRDLHAKVADVGVAKLIEFGKYGYTGPESRRIGETSPKVDVLAFGLVLYEIISGRVAYSSSQDATLTSLSSPQSGSQDETLTSLFEQVLKDPNGKEKLEDLVDPALKDDYQLEAVWKVAQLAQQCTRKSPKKRPTMQVVVVQLGDIDRLSA